MSTTLLHHHAPPATALKHAAKALFSTGGGVRLQSTAARRRISDAVKHDHRELEQARAHILSAATFDEKTRWQNQFAWELARHSVGEELVVYPAMEEHMPNGVALAERDRRMHRAVKEKLYTFQGLSATSDDFTPALTSLWDDLSEHIKEEEDKDLVELEMVLDDESSAQMASSFHRTKMFVPSRSHPRAPDKPPFETVVGLMSAPIDRLGDLFRKFPNQ